MLSNKSLSHIDRFKYIYNEQNRYNLNSVNDKNIYVNFPVCINFVMKMEYGRSS